MSELTLKERVWGDLTESFLDEGAGARGFVSAVNCAKVIGSAQQWVMTAAEARGASVTALDDIQKLRDNAVKAKEAAEALDQHIKWANHWGIDPMFQEALPQILRYMRTVVDEGAALTRAAYVRAVAREAGL